MKRLVALLLSLAVVAGAGGAAAQPAAAAAPAAAPAPEVAPASASAPGAAPASAPAAVDDPAAGPWDRSVALERAGRLDAARAVLLEAYGPAPAAYEVAVRLAWLDLRQRRLDQAIRRYRAARALEGAGPEATQGLAAALTAHGYQLLTRGARGAARAAFTEAAALDPQAADARAGLRLAAPPPAWAPEAWLGGMYASLGAVKTFGGTASVEVPWRPREDLRFRLAFRHVETRTRGVSSAAVATALAPLAGGAGAGAGSGAGGGAGSGMGGLVGRQEELYASAAFTRRLFGAELAGLAIVPQDTDAVFGGALSTRVGFTFGGAADVAVLHLSDGWHTQLTPTLFFWPREWLGLAGGARVTLDPVGNDASARLGATLRRGPLTLLLQAHYGGERWPFEVGSFTVTSLAATLEFGGALTALLRVSPSVDLGLQLQAEALSGGAERGAYITATLGVRWSSGRTPSGAATGAR